MVRWSLEACCAGVWPRCHPSGRPWTEADGKHFTMAGFPMGARAALVHIKGDWAEFAHTFGFMTWSHKDHPCLFCMCCRASLYNTAGLSPLGMPSPLVSHAAYDSACSACEVWVTVRTPAQHSTIAGSLLFDKRSNAMGRALQRDLPELGLLRQDRLEPHAGLWDIGAFERIQLPARVLFWRSGNDSLCRHRTPIFSDTIGVTVQMLEIDVLHALNLGLYLQFVCDVFWSLVRADVYRVGQQRSQDERLQLSTQHLKADLLAWYERMKVERPDFHLHTLQELSPEMLGTWAKPKLKLKAAETKTTWYFAADVARAFPAVVPDGLLIAEAGQCLVRLQDIFDSTGVHMPHASSQDSFKKKKPSICIVVVFC